MKFPLCSSGCFKLSAILLPQSPKCRLQAWANSLADVFLPIERLISLSHRDCLGKIWDDRLGHHPDHLVCYWMDSVTLVVSGRVLLTVVSDSVSDSGDPNLHVTLHFFRIPQCGRQGFWS